MRRIAIAVVASTMTLSLAGCGMLDAGSDSADATPTRSNDVTIGVLLPEKTNTRYAEFDYPIIKEKIAALTDGKGKTAYANAANSAKVQDEQMQKMIDDKVDCILLDAVDSKKIAGMVQKAKDANIPVIAYDRLAQGPIDAYVSFDNELVGEVQGRSLTEALGTADTSDKIVMINGSPTDPNAAQFKEGALSELSGRVTIAAEYDTADWSPEKAQEHMTEAIGKIGKDNIAAVYSANDTMAGGIIKALEAAGLSGSDLPPITGQDAELPGVQRIVSGEQYMTVYKPYRAEAEAAAEAAVAKVQGRALQFEALTRDKVDSPTHKDIPAKLVQVVALTKSNLKDTVIADGVFTAQDICTEKYKSACNSLGLK
ncbi:sugar ABC transporter substrate-binding protein [Streptomyces antibioticus]|uniref:ABC transporter substrate-binding protein n=1 Tax=Streptomyces antibioticus TaxID=1890 RepID=A0AAE6Y9U6_STRAT|nr:substrate-binding domain-containing protein [Streptomyces antibioticus]MCX4737800.1 substrate-binding domain-containing protein [Streptomyces antibioticus]MCX5170412.1 substrate-binding domain-containing protein [Streptomyces antibioticus]OOQ50295.1 ABC transporter substrate-binding protein [Streptomyces antibioticus]QIT45716.1 sugar ABC transporter substrate-binding protein [Streptomyces antibioticus]